MESQQITPAEPVSAEHMEVPPSTFDEQDFLCVICLDVLSTPVKTRQCGHVFCRRCLRTAIRLQGPSCPLCRGRVSLRETISVDIQKHMKKVKGNCRHCGKKKFYSRMRQHYRKCKKIID